MQFELITAGKQIGNRQTWCNYNIQKECTRYLVLVRVLVVKCERKFKQTKMKCPKKEFDGRFFMGKLAMLDISLAAKT